jgi:hypothetical protein
MARLWFLRLSGAIALCSFAFLLGSLDPFLHAAPISTGLTSQTPAVAVNRFRKGDRLPSFSSGTSRQEPQVPAGLQTEQKVPVGCDPAFSPVTAPSLSKVFGRCVV